MSSHYSFYDGVNQVIPFTRRYTYPTQANRAWKSVIKIPPKNGATFINVNTSTPIRFELPASAYLNTRNTFFQFDIAVTNFASGKNIRMQNGILCFLKRLRSLYGTLVCEDIREMHVLYRMLVEATGANNSWVSDQVSVNEGVGGIKMYPAIGVSQASSSNSNPYVAVPQNVRVMEIQCSQFQDNSSNSSNVDAAVGSSGQGAIISGGSPVFRRYAVQLPFGLFQQSKLLPLKWMSAQFAIEMEIVTQSAECMMCTNSNDTALQYTLQNMAIILELIEFDGSYDEEFLTEGLEKDGVPLKFATWDTFQFTPANSTSQTLIISERNRSLKSVFCVQLPPRQFTGVGANGSVVPWDSHAFLESSAGTVGAQGIFGPGCMQDYQFRIGGKMYPAQVVKCNNGQYTNGGVEAYMEFQKSLNIVGDYRLSTAISAARWVRPSNGVLTGGSAYANQGESCCIDWTGLSDVTNLKDLEYYMRGPSCFVIAADLETSDGAEISGLNGEEQNDLQLIINYTQAQSSSCYYNVYVFYDALFILTVNNLVEIIR